MKPLSPPPTHTCPLPPPGGSEGAAVTKPVSRWALVRHRSRTEVHANIFLKGVSEAVRIKKAAKKVGRGMCVCGGGAPDVEAGCSEDQEGSQGAARLLR